MIHALVATFCMMVFIAVGARALELGWPRRKPWADRVAQVRSELRVMLLVGGALLVGWLLTH